MKTKGSEVIAFIEKSAENKSTPQYDPKVFKEWISPEADVVYSKMNDKNICVFIKNPPQDKERKHEKPHYQFLRFFMVGKTTEVSVDYDTERGGAYDPMELLGKLLNNRFGRHLYADPL